MIRSTRRALYLAGVSAAARTPAFLIPIVIAAVFGAGRTTDAYFIAYSAVLFLGGTLAQGVEQAVVPFAAREIHFRSGTARRYLDRAARRSAMVAAGAWIVGVPLFVAVTAAAMRREVVVFAATFTPLALSWCAAAVFAGGLVSQWRIATSTGSLLWRGFGALLGLSLVPFRGGLWGVALGLGSGEIFRVWWLRSRLFSNVAPAGLGPVEPLRPFAVAAGAQVAASAAIAAAPLVERLLAVRLGAGAVSHLEYATRLLIIPGVLFEGALAPLLLARWTNEIAKLGAPPLRQEVLRTVGRGLILAGGCAALLALLAEPLVHGLLGHGRFGEADEVAVTSLLRVLAIAFVATMGALLLERFYLASVRNRTLAGLSIARASVRLLIVILLLPAYGLLSFGIGCAVADSFYLLTLVALLQPSSVTLHTGTAPQVEQK